MRKTYLQLFYGKEEDIHVLINRSPLCWFMKRSSDFIGEHLLDFSSSMEKKTTFSSSRARMRKTYFQLFYGEENYFQLFEGADEEDLQLIYRKEEDIHVLLNRSPLSRRHSGLLCKIDSGLLLRRVSGLLLKRLSDLLCLGRRDFKPLLETFCSPIKENVPSPMKNTF